MTVTGNVSVPSSMGTDIVLSVSGTNTLAYATAFANVLNAAAKAHTLNIVHLGAQTATAHTGHLPPGAGTTEYVITQSGLATTVPSAGAYLLDIAQASTTVTGSGGGDSVLAALSAGGAGGGLTYLDQGGSNSVLFVSGNNIYNGAALSGSTAKDTVIAGAGNDTINTGSNSTTVYSGTGHASITLADTKPGATGATTSNDVVYLADGINTVSAFGVGDFIAAVAPGQTIIAGRSTFDLTTIAIASPQLGVLAADLIIGGAGTTDVFDTVGGSTIYGGAGILNVIAGAAASGLAVADTIQAATGVTNIFGANGSEFTILSAAGGGVSFIAGAGFEALNAAAASGRVTIFGSSGGADSFVAGSGQTTFVGLAASGTDLETITAGAGVLDMFGGSGNALTLLASAGSQSLFVAGAGSETINAAAAAGALTVFASATGTLAVQAGSGSLTFIGGASTGGTPTAAVAAGTGSALLFGGAGDLTTLTGGAGGSAVFIASIGTENLDASGYSGALTMFASNAPTGTQSMTVRDSITGGTGTNYFFTGAGQETLVAGAGSNIFDLTKTLDGIGGTITIYGYNAAAGALVGFSGFTLAQEQQAIRSEKAATGGVIGTQLTLADNTKVTFVDVALHGINFIT